MPKIRAIHPSFWNDTTLADCSVEARLFYIGLWTFADDAGVFEWNPKLLKAQIFPYDQVNCEDILMILKETGVIAHFTYEEKLFGQIVKFAQYQKVDSRYYRTIIPGMKPEGTGLSQEERAARNYIRNPAIRQEVFRRDKNQCVECKRKENLTVDHMTPVSKGGKNDLKNLQTLCRSCNSRKLNMIYTPSHAEPRRVNSTDGDGVSDGEGDIAAEKPPRHLSQHLYPLVVFVLCRKIHFDNHGQITNCIKRNLRASKDLQHYTPRQIIAAMLYAEQQAKGEYDVTLDTVAKKIIEYKDMAIPAKYETHIAAILDRFNREKDILLSKNSPLIRET